MKPLPIDKAAISVDIDIFSGHVTMAWQWNPIIHMYSLESPESLARTQTWSHLIIDMHSLNHALETLGAQLLSIGDPEMMGSGGGGFASRPRGRNHLTGNRWRHFCSYERSARAAKDLESLMDPFEFAALLIPKRG